jgi:hypothetical protein
MEKIRSLQAQGVTVLWMYAPDYARREEKSVCRIADAVGLRAKEENESHGGLVYKDVVYESAVAAPYFSIEDDRAVPYARFEDGAVAVAATPDGRSVYAAVPFVPSAILHDLAKERGVVTYSDTPKVYTYVNASMIGVYNATDAEATVTVPTDGAYRDVITDQVFCSNEKKLCLPLRPLRAYLLVKDAQAAL